MVIRFDIIYKSFNFKICRAKLGPDFVFVTLEMELEDMKQRMMRRHDNQIPMEWVEVGNCLQHEIIF